MALTALAGSGLWIAVSSRDRVYPLDEVPAHEYALVLGAAAYPDGTPSPFLAARLDTAHQLLTAGKVARLLLTGDASTIGLGETEAMRRYLISSGVDPWVIDIDGVGVDTHASCRNAADQGINSVIVVSQTFHLPRAIALCRAAGIDAVGVGDDTVRQWSGEWRLGVVREWFAGIKAAADVVRDRAD